MKELYYTFLTDGSSDKALMPVLTWLLRVNQVECAIQPQWADLRRLRKPPKTLSLRIIQSLELPEMANSKNLLSLGSRQISIV